MFRPYTNVDVVGVELCVALKNIVALGAGAIDGMGYGENAKAGFVTRGLAEIARYGFAEGANPLTVAGLAGFGDLIATCTSKFSRNRTVGEMLAKGVSVAEIPGRLGGQVAEGMSTAEATYRVSVKRGVVMPITEQTHLVLSEGKPIREAMRDLMDREQGDEISGPLAEIHERLGGQVAEGITTAEATYRAAQDAGVGMPITEQTHLVLSDGKPIREAMRDLMQRERGDEVAGPLAELSRLITSAAAAQRDDSAARSPSSR